MANYTKAPGGTWLLPMRLRASVSEPKVRFGIVVCSPSGRGGAVRVFSRYNLQRLEELDYRVLIVFAQSLKQGMTFFRFAMVCQDGLAHGRVHAVMPEGVLV